MRSNSVAAGFRARVILAATAVGLVVACGSESTPTDTDTLPSDVPTSEGHYAIAVSGALTGSTHLDAPPLLAALNAHLDALGVVDQPGLNGKHAEWVIDGRKAVSELGPADGFDLLFVQVNPNLTTPGVYRNNSCPLQSSFGTKCIAIDYNVSRPLSASGSPFYGVLNAIADDRDSLLVEFVGGDRIKFSIVGPWIWTLSPPTGIAQTTDTVMVHASFDAFRMK